MEGRKRGKKKVRKERRKEGKERVRRKGWRKVGRKKGKKEGRKKKRKKKAKGRRENKKKKSFFLLDQSYVKLLQLNFVFLNTLIFFLFMKMSCYAIWCYFYKTYSSTDYMTK